MRKLHVLLLAVLLNLGAGWTVGIPAPAQDCCRPSSSKADQAASASHVAPMSSVSNEDVRKEFNASSGKVRIVSLLSPTCPACHSGHSVVAQTLKKFSSAKLQAILIWEPMRDADSATAAAQQAEAVHDPRIVQGWNENKSLGKLFGETLDLREIAWDVYLVYKPGIKWNTEQPPRPTFWMHQLVGVDPNLLLCENPTRLSAEVGKLLGQSD